MRVSSLHAVGSFLLSDACKGRGSPPQRQQHLLLSHPSERSGHVQQDLLGIVLCADYSVKMRL